MPARFRRHGTSKLPACPFLVTYAFYVGLFLGAFFWGKGVLLPGFSLCVFEGQLASFSVRFFGGTALRAFHLYLFPVHELLSKQKSDKECIESG
jgi:hypothetical protein